jgi:RNA polymerase sigma factor (sigma-70 family)
LRSDEQLVSLFRAGSDDAFRVIHDRYRPRLFAYARQMLPGSRQDAEDALQDVFVRAYAALRANNREVALRAWLYRIAHNRCIDELRRPPVPVPELIEVVRGPVHDPIAEAEQRESLRRLIADVRRLPEQQRSALLMRELSGMSYAELAGALGISVPAIKSLLVRARVSLAQAAEARETACTTIRDELISAHDRRVRPNATARRHLRDCPGCRQFRSDMRGVSRQFAALAPTLGPLGLLANVLGIGGGAGGGAAAAGGAATGGAFAAGGVIASGAAGHVATILAAAVVTAGGAAELQHSISTPARHRAHAHVNAAAHAVRNSGVAVGRTSNVTQPVSVGTSSTASAAVAQPARPAPAPRHTVLAPTKRAQSPAAATPQQAPDAFTLPPTTTAYAPNDPGSASSATTTPGTTSTSGGANPAQATQAPASGTPATSGGATTSSATPATASGTAQSSSGSTTQTGGATGSTTSATSSGAVSSSGGAGASSTSDGSTTSGTGSAGIGH